MAPGVTPGVAPGTSAGCHPVPFLGVTPYRSRGGATSCLESRRVASALGGGRGQCGGEVRNDKRLRALELDGEIEGSWLFRSFQRFGVPPLTFFSVVSSAFYWFSARMGRRSQCCFARITGYQSSFLSDTPGSTYPVSVLFFSFWVCWAS